ncbi:unnamed protein product [Nesidiocoris tenuis]|uniref:Uncharacterized protein n=1 Tax=Nesidiocoris tenuis TaxID=355587 RepID=A0A6H5GPG5_9HEMI|nr:unnamed protein product [Nesidiocoris tenuis]
MRLRRAQQVAPPCARLPLGSRADRRTRRQCPPRLGPVQVDPAPDAIEYFRAAVRLRVRSLRAETGSGSAFLLSRVDEKKCLHDLNFDKLK